MNIKKINERGFTLAGALAIIAIIAIFWALTLPLWARVKQRDNEEELIFRGKEYVEAIARYHQKFGTYPPDLETLEKLKFIRKLYLDPMTKTGKWKVLHPDALLQTGAAGQINQPGGNRNNNNALNDEEDDDEEDMENDEGKEDQLPGMNSNDNEEEEEEEEETESVGPVVGVVSRSKKASIKIYEGQEKYNRWKFVYALPQQQQQQPQPGQPTTPPKGTKTKPGQDSIGQKPPPTPFPDKDDDDNDDDDDER
jgi:type II secretory pathway pseudopilin PulG